MTVIIRKKLPPDYKGQPRSEDGRFARKPNNSKSKGRSVGASSGKSKLVASLFVLPPNVKKPDHAPGEFPENFQIRKP